MLGLFEPINLTPRVELPEPRTSFDYQKSLHLDLINKRIIRFQQAQTNLHSLDSNIVKGLTIGGAAWVGIYFLPLVTVCVGACCLATHYASIRPTYFKEYQDTLKDLTEVYKWSMGRETNDHWHKLGVKQIQELILTLGPCATKDTICTWRSEDLNPATGFYPLRPKRDIEPTLAFKAELAEFAAGNQTNKWQFAIYGENGTDNLLGTLRENCSDWATAAVAMVAAPQKP